jgi:hypothetical protein
MRAAHTLTPHVAAAAAAAARPGRRSGPRLAIWLSLSASPLSFPPSLPLLAFRFSAPFRLACTTRTGLPRSWACYMSHNGPFAPQSGPRR